MENPQYFDIPALEQQPLFTSPLENAFKVLSGYVTGQEERRATKQAQDAQQITAGISAGSYKNSPAWYKQQDGSFIEPKDRADYIVAQENAKTAQYKALQDWNTYHSGETPPSYLTAGLPGATVSTGGVAPSAAAGTLPGQTQTRAQKNAALRQYVMSSPGLTSTFKKLASTDEGRRELVQRIRQQHPEYTESQALEAVNEIESGLPK